MSYFQPDLCLFMFSIEALWADVVPKQKGCQQRSCANVSSDTEALRAT